ncbi:hypothetical protein VSU19_10885 [Verrucomicrobiales bacterium BCK34]|nr:hypothetical protein [Verrucomicrobiales bacterium BCK34]
MMKPDLSSSPWFRTKVAAPEAVYDMPVSRLRALLRDFTTLLGQQMYFWGRDVIHPNGNLLCENGFDRRKSEDLEGTSCYRKSLEDNTFVELHGACAGHYERSEGSGKNFLYIRNRKRCFLHSGDEPPAPGIYAPAMLHNGPALDLYFASLRFLDWWLEYENWIERETSTGWREAGYRAFASLPASRPSLPPQEAILWLNQYRSNPTHITRLSEWIRYGHRQ